MSERREISLEEELKLGQDSFPRCVIFHSQAPNVTISVYPADGVPDLKKPMLKRYTAAVLDLLTHSDDTKGLHFYVLLQTSDCRLEICPDATEIIEVDLPVDSMALAFCCCLHSRIPLHARIRHC